MKLFGTFLIGFCAIMPFDFVVASVQCENFNSSSFFQSASVDDVAMCIQEGADIFSVDADGYMPLHHAIEHANTPLILDELFFVASDAERLENFLAYRDEEDFTIMHFAAARAKDPAMLVWLSSWGFSVLEGAKCGAGFLAGCTDPLHLAAQRSDAFDFVATLLALGSSPDVIDANDLTPLDLAKWVNPGEFDAMALLSGGSWPEDAVGTLTKKSNMSCDQFVSADFFQRAEVSDVVKCLDEGSYPTATGRDGNTALHHAAAQSPYARVIDQLMYVLQKDNPEDYTAALRRTNASGHSVLHHAASMSTQLRVISRLLAWGADPNGLAEPIKRARIGEDRGTTPLHLAAKRSDGSREGIVRVLLAGGANTFQQDHGPEQSGGRQALHYAAAYDADVRVIELLQQVQLSQQSIIGAVGDRARIAVRRDPKMIKDDKQRTALHVATSRDANLDVLWSLLQFGFSPDDEDHKGVTPLMRSAEKSSDPDTFYLLLDSAKNPCQASADGYTVEAYLKNNEHLSNFDSSGAEASPLENLKERCP